MEHITSSSNPKIRQVRDLLARTGARRKAGLFVVEGPKMVEEAFRYAKVQSVFVAEASMKETADGGEHGALLAQLSGCPSYEVPDSLMKSLSDTVHPQGVLAVAEMPSYDLQAILAEGDDSAQMKFLVLEDIQDPGNLGTMMRTAEAAGMHAVIMSRGTVDLFNPKVVRATMGSIYRVPFVYTENLQDTLRDLQEHGIVAYACHLHGEDYYSQDALAGRRAILIGNEANGLSDAISALADVRIRIPMAGQVESLNAAVAAALMMYHR